MPDNVTNEVLGPINRGTVTLKLHNERTIHTEAAGLLIRHISKRVSLYSRGDWHGEVFIGTRFALMYRLTGYAWPPSSRVFRVTDANFESTDMTHDELVIAINRLTK